MGASHGGEIKVETPSDRAIRAGLSAVAAAQAGKEGEGSIFIITLPGSNFSTLGAAFAPGAPTLKLLRKRLKLYAARGW